MDTHPLVSVLIINWNGRKYLTKCLTTLFSQRYKNIEVILVDNASTDGSVEYVRREFPSVTIIRNTTNLGFAEANNIGYVRCKGKYVLLLNNDTWVTEDFLFPLVRLMESDQRVGGVQSKILLMDQENTLDAVGAFFTATGFLYHYGITENDSPKFQKQIDLYSAKGACLLLRSDVVKKVSVDNEMFDSRYFAYFEETDLCHRLWLAGYRVVFEPNSVIYHKMGGTSDTLVNSFIQFHSFKNRINSYVKNLSISNLLRILPIHIVIVQLVALSYLVTMKVSVFIAIEKAVLWNVANLANTLQKRKYVQGKIRKVPDSQFIPRIKKNVGISYYLWLLNYNNNGAFNLVKRLWN